MRDSLSPGMERESREKENRRGDDMTLYVRRGRMRRAEPYRGGNDRGNIGIEIEKARLQSPELSKTRTRARQKSGGGQRGQSGRVCGEMGVRE